MSLDTDILGRHSRLELANEAMFIEVLTAILRREVGTKEQRAAIIRIIGQVKGQVIDTAARTGIKKAITKISLDFQIKGI